MRPRTLAEFVGQRHILGVDDRGRPRLLRRMIDADAVMSLIFSGPPGTGKTTLAEVIAGATKRRFVRENAASVGVKRIREIIDEASAILGDGGKRTILFLDEIHRFTKSQQDVLLGDVERGLITLIGATTENPLFAVNSALISRSTLFRLEPLSEAEIVEVLRRAIADPERGYGGLQIELAESAARVWAIKSEGDARRAVTALEVAVRSTLAEAVNDSGRDRERRPQGSRDDAGIHLARDPGHDLVLDHVPLQRGRTEESAAGRPGAAKGRAQTIVIDEDLAEASIQEKVAVYGEDGHYDAASALIKSVRGNDPDAAVYWIARMLDAGEDPRFIARRLAILASEDVGNADLRGVMMAQSCWDLVERIGLPEARIALSQCATYLSLAPKSNAAYAAIKAAETEVKEGRVLPVPLTLRDPNTVASSATGSDTAATMRTQRDEGAAKYRYSHSSTHRAEVGGVTDESYLGVDRQYYEPTESGEEAVLKRRLDEVRRLRRRLRGGGGA